jgi:glycosyltransferase involved in cell wall biosynthesis
MTPRDLVGDEERPVASQSSPALDLAVLVYDLRGSGAVLNAVRIAERAAAAGLNTELWVLRLQGQLEGATPAGLRVVALAAGRGGAEPRVLDSVRLIGALARAIETRRPSVLFSAANHIHAFAALAHRRAGARTGTRLVGRASNAVLHERLGPWAHPLGRAVVMAAKAVQRLQFSAMDRIIAVAPDLAGDLASGLGIEPGRITVIPNGIDAADVARRSSQPLDDPWFAPGEPPVVLGVGRLSFQKNFPLLIRAFARARRRRPMRLIILGYGPPAKARALLALAQRLGVGGDVKLPGFEVSPCRYMARSDLFVLSSRWEGASNVLLEALACGCPVAATDCPTGVADVLGGGAFGPLVSPGDADALAEAILKRLDEPRDSVALRAQAARYDLNRSLDRYAEVLAQELALVRAASAHAGQALPEPIDPAI